MDEYRMIEAKDISGMVSGFFSFIVRIISYVLSALRRFFLPALVVFAIIVGAFLYYQRTLPAYYQSEMACMYSNLSKRTYGEMIEKLNGLLRSGSYKALSETIHLSEQEAASIVSIEAVNLQGAPILEDFSAGSSPFYVRLKAKRRDVFEPFQEGVVAYLNSSPFRRVRNKADMDKMWEKVAMLGKDMAVTDSVLAAYTNYLHQNGMKQDTGMALQNVVALVAYKEQLEDKLLDMKRKTADLYQSVDVLHGFITPDNPTPVTTKYTLPRVVILALLVSCLVAVACKGYFERTKALVHEPDIAV